METTGANDKRKQWYARFVILRAAKDGMFMIGPAPSLFAPNISVAGECGGMVKPSSPAVGIALNQPMHPANLNLQLTPGGIHIAANEY